MKPSVAALAVFLVLAFALVGCTQQQPQAQGNNIGKTVSTESPFDNNELSDFDNLLQDTENDVNGLENNEMPPETFPE